MRRTSPHENKRRRIFFVILLALIIAILVSVYVPILFYNFFNKEQMAGISIIYDVATIMGSFIIVYIAYINLFKMADDASANFLLEIDKRFCDPQSKVARTIIHEMHLKQKQSNSHDPTTVNSLIAKEITQLSQSLEHSRKFISLLIFLDFMETIGLFYKKEYVTLEDLDELCGESIGFFYEIYSDYINHIRTRKSNEDYCKDFEFLALVLYAKSQKQKGLV